MVIIGVVHCYSVSVLMVLLLIDVTSVSITPSLSSLLFPLLSLIKRTTLISNQKEQVHEQLRLEKY